MIPPLLWSPPMLPPPATEPLLDIPSEELDCLEAIANDLSLTIGQRAGHLVTDRLLHAPCHRPDLSIDTAKELFGQTPLTQDGIAYWEAFLATPTGQRFQQGAIPLSDFKQAAADYRSCQQNPNLVLTTEAERLASLLAHTKRLIFLGSVGPRPHAPAYLNWIIRNSAHLPHLLQHHFPEFTKSNALLFSNISDTLPLIATIAADPHAFLCDLIREKLKKDLPKESDKYPKYTNIATALDIIAALTPQPEILDLLDIIAELPTIDQVPGTGLASHLMRLFTILPISDIATHTHTIETTIARLKSAETHDAAVDELIALTEHIRPLTNRCAIQLHKKISSLLQLAIDKLLSNPYTEAAAEALQHSGLLGYSPYVLQLDQENNGTYTALIYATGPALSHYRYNNDLVQWPRRIRGIDPARLTPAFFKRLLEHRHCPDYDAAFLSRAADLFGPKGTFDSLQGSQTCPLPLPWRALPYHSAHDLHLLKETTSRGDQALSLFYLQRQALIDLMTRNHMDALDELMPHLIDSYASVRHTLLPQEDSDTSDLITTMRKMVAKQQKKQLISPHLIKPAQQFLASRDLDTKTIRSFLPVVEWLFDSETHDLLARILDSIDRAPKLPQEAVAPTPPPKSAFVSFMHNIYVSTILCLIRAVLVLAKLTSPFGLISLFRILMQFLPQSWQDTLNKHTNRLLRYLAKHIIITLTSNLLTFDAINPQLIKATESIQQYLHVLSAALNEKRHITLQLPSSPTLPDTNHTLLPHILPFCHFAPYSTITHLVNNSTISEVKFSGYDITFKTERVGGIPKAFCRARFGNFFIAENQEYATYKWITHYLLLSNDSGEKKLLVPENTLYQLITEKLLPDLSPLNNLISPLITHLFDPKDDLTITPLYEYTIGHDHQPTTDDPDALCHLIITEILAGSTKRATDRTKKLLATASIPAASMQKLLFWTSLLFLIEHTLTADQIADVHALSSRLFSFAAEHHLLDSKNNEVPEDLLILKSLFDELSDRATNRRHLRGLFTVEARQKEEWLLYNAYLQKATSLTKQIPVIHAIHPIVALNGAMTKRYLLLEKKFGTVSVGQKLALFAKNSVLNIQMAPPQNAFADQLTNHPLAIGINFPTVMIDERPNHLARYRSGSETLTAYKQLAIRAVSDPHYLATFDYNALALSMQTTSDSNLPLPPPDKKTLFRLFPFYYKQAETMPTAVQLSLQPLKGGWDCASSALIDILLYHAASPLTPLPTADALLYALQNGQDNGQAAGLLRTMVNTANHLRWAGELSLPMGDILTIATTFAANYMGGLHTFYSSYNIPAFAALTTLVTAGGITYNQLFSQETLPTNSSSPRPTIHDTAVITELYRIAGLPNQRAGLTRLITSLQKSLDTNQQRLMRIMETMSIPAPGPAAITFDELAHAALHGDYSELRARTRLDNAEISLLDRHLVRTLGRHERLDQLSAIARNLLA